MVTVRIGLASESKSVNCRDQRRVIIVVHLHSRLPDAIGYAEGLCHTILRIFVLVCFGKQ
jgi:hypothetical protein